VWRVVQEDGVYDCAIICISYDWSGGWCKRTECMIVLSYDCAALVLPPDAVGRIWGHMR